MILICPRCKIIYDDFDREWSCPHNVERWVTIYRWFVMLVIMPACVLAGAFIIWALLTGRF